MANDSGLNQLHPGIFSTISSDQTTYETSAGVITAFAADVFEKGPDGQIDFVSTKEEFIFKYGEPNYNKYGQTAYNLIKFLEAGGQAYVMRILPDDATFAHGILNIQTKVKKDGKVVEINGVKHKLDDVTIRPANTLIKRNNLSLNMLEEELNRDRSKESTVDGFSNNFVMLVVPNGRGESYNSLGFRLTPNDSFSTITNSRVYNFEVVRFDKDSNVAVIEGPFYVTFDPDSLSETEDSMFIEDVINRQSKHLRVRVNLRTLAQVAKTINPNVAATRVDILAGGAFDAEPDTTYNPITKRDEDIHVSLHKYNSAGSPILRNGKPVLNIPEATDVIQSSLLTLDNGLRENAYSLANNKMEYMKTTFPALRSEQFNEFNTILDKILHSPDAGEASGTLHDLLKELDQATSGSLYAKYLEAKAKYTGEDKEENLNAFTALVNQLSEVIRTDIIENSNKVSAAYTLVEHNSPNPEITAKYNSNIDQIISLLSQKDQIGIFTSEHRSLIYKIQREIFGYKLGTTSGSVVEGLALVLNDIENEIRYVYESLLPVAYTDTQVPTEIADKFSKDSTVQPNSLVVKYNSALDLLEDMKRGIVPDAVKNREIIFSAAHEITNGLLEVINKVVFQASSTILEKVVTLCTNNLLTDVKAFLSAIKTMIKTSGTYTVENLLKNSRQQIEIEISKVANAGSAFFNSNLIDFNNPVKLILGSDGTFKYNALESGRERSEAIRRHLIKAYNGTINPDVLNRELYRFNVIFDARYHTDVKKAIADLARNVRQDFIFFADDAGPEYSVAPQTTIEWRRSKFTVSSEYVAIYAQDFTFFDEYTGRDIRFTTPYIIAGKLPVHAVQHGLHYTLAGVRRGLVDGFKAISWSPNEAYREKLYVNKVNYVQQDKNGTRFGSQLTSINSTGAVSYLNNMFTILEIKRGAEDLLAAYQFEFNDDETISTLYTELNNYLSKFRSNRSCESIVGDVERSEYDKSQRIVRVNISIKFTGVIERIVLNLQAKK